MPLTVPLDTREAALADVGGKALSLNRMMRAGLAVPPGFVLTVEFFAPWLEAIRRTVAWRRFLDATTDAALRETCYALKRERLILPEDRRDALRQALVPFPSGELFAVRSSSPEEDMSGASFAGGYETVLGVDASRLEDAARRAFVSCLDVRVVLYKRQHGFDPKSPRIAVIVQRQISSDVAGVAFSLNPLTNDHDEMVVDANWGLGETVVSGTVTADQYIVDRARRRAVSRRLGAKQMASRIGPTGAVESRADPRRDTFCLIDTQLAELTDQVARVEALYGGPVDVEWAFAERRLHLLQARPITTYFEPPADMMTASGAPRRLYLDVTISAQGLLRPMSPMATSMFRAILRRVFGVAEGVVISRHGRLFVDLSNPLTRDRLASKLRLLDPVAADALATADPTRYAGPAPRVWRFLRHAPMAMLRVLAALVAPARARRNCDLAVDRVRRDDTFHPQTRVIARTIAPAFVASKVAMALIGRLVRDPLVERLDQSLPGNVTVEMGRELAAMARPPHPDVWSRFLARYGHRGAGELDPATPRYRERPEALLRMLPAGAASSSAEARLSAVRELATRLRGPVRWLFLRLARVVELLGGLRETPKFLMVTGIDAVRQRARQAGRELVAAGRLDRVEDVFDLAIEDLDSPHDLRERARKRRASHDRLAAQGELPRLFDSRGRLLRPPPRAAKEGELAGHAVSAGVARGPVKVLHEPDEKPVLPGDVLVARATDPGWTPLFINASAVVLEVGGMLQHGALVAREYGKPCVVGVEGATKLADGRLVEVDGAAGIVRLL